MAETRARVRMTRGELADLIDQVKANGGNAEDLEGLLAEVTHSKPGPPRAKAEDVEARLEDLREQAEVSQGECMICHQGPAKLYAGTCDPCFTSWMLSVITEPEEVG